MTRAELQDTEATGILRGTRGGAPPSFASPVNVVYTNAADAKAGLALPVMPEVGVAMQTDTDMFTLPSGASPNYGEVGGEDEMFTSEPDMPVQILYTWELTPP
jgi:hypothetical protein